MSMNRARTQREVDQNNLYKNKIDNNERPKLIEQLNKLASKKAHIFFISTNKDAEFAYRNGLSQNYPRELIQTYSAEFNYSLDRIKKDLNAKLQSVFSQIVMSSKGNKELAERIGPAVQFTEKKVEIFKEDTELEDVIDALDIEGISLDTRYLILETHSIEELVYIIRFRIPMEDYITLKRIFNSMVRASNIIYDVTDEERILIEDLNNCPRTMQKEITDLYRKIAHDVNVKEKLEEFIQAKLPKKAKTMQKDEIEETNECDEKDLKVLIGNIMDCLDNISIAESDFIRSVTSFKDLKANIRFDLSPDRINTINNSGVGISIEPISVAAQLAVRIFVDRLQDGPKQRLRLSVLSVDDIFEEIGRQIAETADVDPTVVLRFEFLRNLRDTKFDGDNELLCDSEDLQEIAAKVNFMVSRSNRADFVRVYRSTVEHLMLEKAPKIVDVSGIEDEIEGINNQMEFFMGLVGLTGEEVENRIHDRISSSTNEEREEEIE